MVQLFIWSLASRGDSFHALDCKRAAGPRQRAGSEPRNASPLRTGFRGTPCKATLNLMECAQAGSIGTGPTE